MSCDIKKSAGTIAHPNNVIHQGEVTHLDRKWNRVRWPPSRGRSTKTQDQSRDTLPLQLMGKWLVERSAIARPGSRRSTMSPHSVSGAPSGMKSPTWMFCSSGMIRFALGQFSGNSSWSTQRAVYQPARCQPICTSHGQTLSGGASMSMAWLVTTCGLGTMSSPGRSSARSAGTEP